ncbi:monovalent cation/H+ antiporter subunit D family protein [Elusimicrobiota bacterium]
MEIVQSCAPFYAVIVSLVAVVLIGFSNKNKNLRESWTIIASVIKFLIVVSILPAILGGKIVECHIFTLLPGLDIKLRVDALGIFFALTASFLWIVTSFYSIGYVRALNEHAQTRYFMCFAAVMSATIGVAFSANLITLFVFYEIITLATYPLVAHKETAKAMSATRKYLVYLLGTSVAFQLFAIFLTYKLAGTLDFANSGILAGTASKFVLTCVFVLFMAGVAKAAMMPFHSWLPAAMVAPTPVSALLHAVAIVKVGVFFVIRIVLHIFGVDLMAQLGIGTVFAYFASFTIIVASVIALRQDDLKARLAYSTISQLSYIVLGVALLTPLGITGSIMHIVIHAFGKITLFFTAGAIYVATHKTKISELNGIARQMPFTIGAFSIGALSMIGVPPAAGFISKWYLVLGSLHAHQIPIFIVLIASTILNACYFLPIIYAAVFKGRETGIRIKEAPMMMVIPLMLTAFGTLVLFFWPGLFMELVDIILMGLNNGKGI